MRHSVLADLVLAIHLGFILFVMLGALLVWRFPRLAWLHVPAVLWGIWIELSGGICPLTPLENHLRRLAGEAGYSGDFIGHYLLPIVYPRGLTPDIQLLMGLAVFAINAVAYGLLWHRKAQRRRAPESKTARSQ